MPQPLYRPAPIDASADAERHAYNCAFRELDLDWYWDEVTFAGLQPYGRAGLRAWVQHERPHLLRAYDLDFLVDAIERVKAVCLQRDAVPAALHPSCLAA